MPENSPPISQVIRNYCTNLPVFPPEDHHLRKLHASLLDFYSGFIPAAQALGVADGDQGAALERVQKTLWTFAAGGQFNEEGENTSLVLERDAVLAGLKFSRPETVFALMARLGWAVELRGEDRCSEAGNLKTCHAARLVSPLAAALKELAGACTASSPKPKTAYERFLRVNPRSLVAGDKPPLDLPPDHPAILANLPPPAAQAWQSLVHFLADFDGFTPTVEFRAIHHGLWTANYNSRRGGRDLCGLAVQNSSMSVRIILYGEGHVYIKERLVEFGEVIGRAFRAAHYYEEFRHQWLFVPVNAAEDLPGVFKLMALMPVLLKMK